MGVGGKGDQMVAVMEIAGCEGITAHDRQCRRKARFVVEGEGWRRYACRLHMKQFVGLIKRIW